MLRTTVTLIRHGETEWNRASRWQGHTDVSLSAVGLLQARRLAERFSAEAQTFSAIYSSDLRRALQTSESIGAALGLAPIPVPDLRELDVGAWSGLYDHEVAVRFPDEWQRVRNDEDIPRGGGENMAALSVRVCRAFQRIAQQHRTENVGIVTHNGVIRAILVHINGMPVTQCNDLGAIHNCSVTVVSSASGEEWKVERVNDTAHLQGFTPPADLLAL